MFIVFDHVRSIRASAREVQLFGKVAGDIATVDDALQFRRLLLTALLSVAAAGMEGTAGWRIGGIGNLTLQDDSLALAVGRPRHMDSGEQRLSVGMQGLAVEIVGVGLLHQIADVHDRHPVAYVFDNTEIVGDEKIGQVQFPLQKLQ